MTSASPDPLRWLADAAARRDTAGLARHLQVREARDTLLDLAGNDYLGLSRDPRVIEAAVAALRTWGAGATGSRLVSGSTRLHADLEAALAGFCGYPAALVFASGYAANLAVVTALAGPGSLVVSTRAVHASLVDAARLSRARVVLAEGLAEVEAALGGRAEEHAVVLTDTVDSGSGALLDVAALAGTARRHAAVLIADEAHALGVLGPGGRGALAAVGLAGESDVVATVTLSKALGAQGGAVLGSPEVIAHLVATGRSFIFDTGLAPASAGAALAALRILLDEPGLPGQVLAAAAALAAAAGVGVSGSAVVPIVLGGAQRAFDAARHCRDLGVAVGCFRPPAVPAGTARLRLTARADLSAAQIARAGDALRSALRRVGAA